jgi:hypothetical protein
MPSFSRHEEITAPMIGAFGGKDIDGASMDIGFSYITEPVWLITESHKHDFDQYLFLLAVIPITFLTLMGK